MKYAIAYVAMLLFDAAVLYGGWYTVFVLNHSGWWMLAAVVIVGGSGSLIKEIK